MYSDYVEAGSAQDLKNIEQRILEHAERAWPAVSAIRRRVDQALAADLHRNELTFLYSFIQDEIVTSFLTALKGAAARVIAHQDVAHFVGNACETSQRLDRAVAVSLFAISAAEVPAKSEIQEHLHALIGWGVEFCTLISASAAAAPEIPKI